MPTSTSTVTTLYEEIDNVSASDLSYAASSADIATFAGLLTAGNITVPTLISDIENDPFTVGTVDPIIREYQAAFGRVPDQGGLAYWVGQVASGAVTLAELSTVFANSAEFMARYGANASTIGGVALVSALYENVLGRTPDQAGLDYWVAQGDTAAVLLQAFAQSTEFVNDTATAILAFQNLEAAGTPPPPTESLYDFTSYTLTTAAADISGYANVTADLTPYFYNGVGPTLVSGDVITNVGTLTITDEYAQGTDIIPAGASLSNIAHIVLDTAGNAGSGTGSPFNVAGIAGVETVTVNSSGAHYDFVEAAQTTDITVNHSSTGGGVTSLGGDDVAITSNGDGYVSVGLVDQGIAPANATLLPVGAISVTYNGDGHSSGTQSGIFIAGGTSVTVDVTASNSEAFVSIGNTPTNTGDFVGSLASAVNPTGAITVTDNAVYGGDEDAANNAWIEIYGGTSVTVTAKGEEVTVGDPFAVNASNQPTGAVSITDLAPYIWSETGLGGIYGQEEDVSVSGGTDIAVDTNTGDVFIGDYYGLLNVASTAALAGTQPSGTVTVVDTATDEFTYIGVAGGTDVTINGPKAISDADIQVGASTDGVVIAPTGTITIYDNAAVAWGGTLTHTGPGDPADTIAVGDTGIGHTIEVLGGTDVSITTNTASVTVGADTGLGDPSGTITVVDTATAQYNDAGNTYLEDSTTTFGAPDGGISDAYVTVYGGTNVSVTASGMDVTVGAPGATPTGTVTVTDTATAVLAYDELLSTYDAAISILGGTDISVTTNVGDVFVGAGGTAVTGLEPTGTVTVVDDSTGYVAIYGGTTVNVTSEGGYIQVGDGAVFGSPATDPTGPVTATMTAVETGWLWDTSVKIEGGTDVTVNTTGGNVYVGTDWYAANITGVSAAPVTGAVVINDTYGGITQDDIAVMGGTTVTITTSASDHDYIQVGGLGPGDDPTGNVVIVDDTVVGSTTIYGKENFYVITDGATSVSVTGGAGHDNYIEDFQSFSSGGTPIGTATLADVSLTGVNGIVEIGSNALSDLTIDDSNWSLANIYNDTLNSSLTLNIANDANVHLQDEGGFSSASVGGAAYIATLTVDVTGAAPSVLTLDTLRLTTLNINDTAGLTLGDSWPGQNLDSLTTINVSGSGTTNLGALYDYSGLTDIDASAATGAVLVGLDPETTSFTGGSGHDVVVIDEEPLAVVGAPVIDGGTSGDNLLYAFYYGDSTTQTPLGGTVTVENFQHLGVSGGFWDALAFSQLQVGIYDTYGGGYSGAYANVIFNFVELGASLDLVDPNGHDVDYDLAVPFTSAATGYLDITIGQDGNAITGTDGVGAFVDASTATFGGSNNIGTVSIASEGNGSNLLLLDDSSLTKLVISGDDSLSLTATAAGTAVSSINASGTTALGTYVNAEDVILNTTGVTDVGGAATLFVAGGATAVTGVDSFTLGSGGGFVVLGAGGAGYAAGSDAVSTGSETVALDPAAPIGTFVYAVPDVDGVGDGAYGVVSGWTMGTVTSGQGADAVALESPIIIANDTNVVETYGKYDISDGVISLATGSAIPSATEELANAETIVDSAAVGTVAMVTVEVANGTGGETPATFLIQNAGGTAANLTPDVFVELVGVSGVTGFGYVPGGGPAGPLTTDDIGGGTSVSLTGFSITALDTVFANLKAHDGGAGVSTTYHDTGYAIDTLTGPPGAGVTTTYANLGNFGIIEASNDSFSNVTVTQVGADPVLVLAATGPENTDIGTLTYGNSAIKGDTPTLVIETLGYTVTIDQVVDASNSGTTILVMGDNNVTIDSVSDTALKDVNASQLDAYFELHGVSQAGLTITGSLEGNSIVASGKGDVISIGSVSSPLDAYDVTITATGAGDVISAFGGYVDIAAPGAGDVITVAGNYDTAYVTGLGDEASYTAAAGNQLGAGDTLNVGASPDPAAGFGGLSGDVHAWLGANSTVNIYDHSDVDLHLLGDTAGTSLTNLTTINEVDLGHLRLHLDEGNATISTEAWAGGSLADSQVNVASATSLAAALNLAASEALNINGHDGAGGITIVGQNTLAATVELNGHTGLVDWFDYGGNTYVVEVNNGGATAAAHAGLESGDIVIKFTGIVDLGHHTDFALV